MADVPAAADQLYDLLPQDFTDARNRLARSTRADGQAEEAATIAALRRPTVGAWLTNQLARRRRTQLSALLELGRDLRAAQAAFAGDELRRRAPERRKQVDELVVAAREIAAETDQAMSDAAEREVRQSLQAALADEDAADALEAGRLSRPLTAGDTLGAFGVPAAEPPATTRAKPAPKQRPAKSGAVDLAERRLRDAKAAAAETAKAAAEAVAALERAEREYADAGRRIAQLESLLREARELQTSADRDARAAREESEQAKRADERAQRALERAQALYDG